jgi:N-ethylmaleimide reductase
VAPSPIAITGDEVHTPQGKQPYVLPRELGDDELPAIVEGFRLAARHAMAAGFDGVEVHGANGYLLDEFLRDGSNQRSGPYGGALENRARLLFEVPEALTASASTQKGACGAPTRKEKTAWCALLLVARSPTASRLRPMPMR